MKDLSKKVTEEAIVKTIGEAIGAAIIFAAGAIWGGLKLISNNPALAPFKSLLWILGIGVGIIVAVVIYFQRRKKYSGNDFLLEKLEIRYEWKSPQEIIYSRRYRLRALKNDVDRFPDRFRWSANGRLEMKTTVAGHLIAQHSPNSLYDSFEICFNLPCRKGQVIETEVIWELDDLNCKSRPFISRSIYEPTEELVMQLQLPATWNIDKVSTWETPSAGAKRNIDANYKPVNNGKCEWSPDKPLKDKYHYEIRWDWPETLRPTTHPNGHEYSQDHPA